jgi:hypothetical protein
MSKITFNIGDLVEFQKDNEPLSLRDNNTDEYFNVGDLFLVADDKAIDEKWYPQHYCYHFISAKTGSSIYWDKDDLEEQGCSKWFKKVKM